MLTPRSMLDRQLFSLRDQLAQLSDSVEQSIALSVKALQKHDLPLARLVDQFDNQVNARRFEIEEQSYNLLALQQPNSSDMRAIVATVSVVTNVERIGDYAAGIARLVQRMGDHPACEAPSEFGLMGAQAQWMLHNAVSAFTSHDQLLAQSVITRDAEIDDLHRSVYRKLVAAMAEDPSLIECCTLLLWVSHNLERIGDRSATIAQRVTYLVTGQLVAEVRTESRQSAVTV